ncbi:MAG: hypothetical protein VX000_14930, partial [Myxococcota bacterium]|nr:hypothetical protein [Myxococcota bacterium]
MHRAVGLANFAQAAAFAAAAVWLGARWMPAACIAGVCAGVQAGGGLVLLSGRSGRLARWASAVSLVGVALLLGLFLHASQHLISRFGADAAATGESARAMVALAVPWFAGFPLWQVLHGRSPDARTVGGGGAVLAALLLPPGVGLLAGRPDASWSSVGDARVEAAAAALSLWRGDSASLPDGDGPAVVLLTPWKRGQPGSSVRGEGEGLATAVTAAVRALPPFPDADVALVLDVAVAQWDGGLVPVAHGGRLGPSGGQSPTVAWRPDTVKRRQIAPHWTVPQPSPAPGRPARFESAVADETGARAVEAAWVAPTALSADAARDAALAGARHIVANQKPDGKFTY